MDFADKLDMMDDDCDIEGFPAFKEDEADKRSPIKYYTNGEPYLTVCGVEIRNHPLVDACARLDRYEKYVIPRLQATLEESRSREKVAVVRCKDCRFKDKQLCRAAVSVRYDLRREKHIFKTLMEPDGFCSIGERPE